MITHSGKNYFKSSLCWIVLPVQAKAGEARNPQRVVMLFAISSKTLTVGSLG